MAAQAEQVKVSKYAHLDTSPHFVPFVVETSGVLVKAAEEFMQELAIEMHLQSHWRALQPAVPPSETAHVCCGLKGNCSSSPQKHGGGGGADRTAGSDLHSSMLITL